MTLGHYAGLETVGRAAVRAASLAVRYIKKDPRMR